MKKRNIGLITNSKKDRYLSFTREIVRYLSDKKLNVYIENDVSDETIKECRILNSKTVQDVEFIIIIGGDGTILKGLARVGKSNKPILGINLGKVGFLANVEKNGWKDSIDRVLSGDYSIDERMLLDVYDKNEKYLGFALNDTVLFRKHYGVCEYKVFINEELFADYLADGIIVAGPTGSTAYNLSSGGPVVSPNCELFIVNPICPHTLNNTCVIVDSKDSVRIKFNPRISKLFIDSINNEIEENEIVIKKSNMKAKFIRFDDYNFYSLLVNKIKNPIIEGES